MTTAEQADRTARNVLELVQLRRQIAAVRALCVRARNDQTYLLPVDVEGALDHAQQAQALDPEEVSA